MIVMMMMFSLVRFTLDAGLVLACLDRSAVIPLRPAPNLLNIPHQLSQELTRLRCQAMLTREAPCRHQTAVSQHTMNCCGFPVEWKFKYLLPMLSTEVAAQMQS